MKPKKIILIVIDSLRQDHLGCYGYKRDTTPNIDALAKSAVLFKHAFAVCPNTVPSIASILTSKYPGNHSIGFDPEGKLDAQVDRTLASILKENNYRTAAFSGRGKLRGLSPGFDIFDDGEGRRDCQAINEKVFEWLDENYRQDFFLFLHYFDAHGPYLSPELYRNMFVNDEFYGSPEYIKNISDKEPALNSIPGYQILNSGENRDNDPADHENDIRYYGAQYDACIRSIDDNIGKLQEKLKKLKIYEDSLIIITSDHGEAFGENNIFLEHGLSVTLEQIAVPLLIKPHKGEKIKPGTRNIHICNIDLMPTILSLCDHENEAIGLDGHSLKKIFEEKKDAILEERTLTSENECQFALIYSNKLMEIKKKDFPTSQNYPNIASLNDSLNGKKFSWDSGQDYYLSISFDQYQRYKIISDIINKFRTDNKTFKILDVGASFEENLTKFLPFDDIYYLDKDYPLEYKQRANFIIGDITRLELDETYDFVVSIDTYEHIPVYSREKFINNLLHLSRIATIIAAPFNTPGVRENEILANELYKLSHGKEYVWLHEHIQNGLPSLPFTIELVKKSGFEYAVIPNGYLPRWHEMISTYLMTEGMPEFSKSLEELNEFYNKNFYCYDNFNPAYRQVIVINKSDIKIDFSDIHSNNFKADKEFSIKYEMLHSFIKNIMDFYSNHRYKELKDKELKEKDKELKEKEFELKEKDKILQEKNAQIVDYSQIVNEKNKHVTELTNALNEKNVQITYLSGSLQSMQQSMVWQLTMKFHRIVEYIFPFGTRRRRTYGHCLIFGRTLFSSEWRGLLIRNKKDNYLKKYPSKIEIPPPGKIETQETKKCRWGSKEVEITDVKFFDKNGEERYIFKTGEMLIVRMRYSAKERIETPVFGIAIHRNDGVHITGPNTKSHNNLLESIEGEGAVEYIIESIPLFQGTYEFTAAIHDINHTKAYDHHEKMYTFKIEDGEIRDQGLLYIPCKWKYIK